MACQRCHSVAKPRRGPSLPCATCSASAAIRCASSPMRPGVNIPKALQPFTMTHGTALPHLQVHSASPGPTLPNASEFVHTYHPDGEDLRTRFSEVRPFPPESNDHVVGEARHRLESLPHLGPVHGLPQRRQQQVRLRSRSCSSRRSIGGLNVSPYGEWRWSPMGLAGRDPVFHAQLESEMSACSRPSSSAKQKGTFVRRGSREHLPALPRRHGQAPVRPRPRRRRDAYWDQKARFDQASGTT